MILIYTNKVTNRIKYIFNLIFRELLNVDIELTSNKEDFIAFEGIKFSYAKQPLDNELFFAAGNLLFERGITNIELSFIEFEGMPAFFPVYMKESVMPFDPFAASFYLISRYEEYLPYRKDEYGRFHAKESIAYKKGFLQKPLVNIWALKIGEIIKERYPSISFPGKKYKFVPTIDIDAAWAYRQKGLFRIIGGYFNSLSGFNFAEIVERTKVLAGLQKDPFDTFGFQLEIHKKYNLKPIYFILFADYGFNDKNIPVQSRKFQTLIKSLADYAEVGIHPSYGSNSYPKKLKTEVERLSKVLNSEITKSRQHFLKVLLPTSYRNLINLDITDDYTMGFAAQPGFRAGICNSFNFYDLDLDTETKLRVHPFILMEGTLKDYLGVNADEALQYIKPLINEVKAANGTFISLWHNESLSNAKRWVGWHKVYEDMIKEALP
ncbi:MAG: polysaccharide deacetylase family protein [Bacteroidetes bacterium]|nr:polysaccharide deacetylase family protein [Bacteroidota bacterium]MBL7103198.1 polysaccharide deacetylase family protein [Bacteroidales bacterium]